MEELLADVLEAHFARHGPIRDFLPSFREKPASARLRSGGGPQPVVIRQQLHS